MQIAVLFYIAVLIMSVVIHEISHGWVADYLGDPTARLAGRLTLNPLKHLDWFGSVIIPALLIWLGGFVIGWAKPVPYNPHNLRGGRWGPAYVAAAGPASNLLLALIFGLLFRFNILTVAASLISVIILLNIMLAIFNLIPVPPLDGSKILFAALPYRLRHIEDWFMRHQLIIIVAFLFLIANSHLLDSLVARLFYLFTGSIF
ncbi:MAG: site-2 protease family protein [Candidatus Vogelbacteria bacterium]|nr:site-2 protease family protein [Candidatus Vogelbacteria bacterium]